MSTSLNRIAPWQAAKVCAVIYFLVGLIFAIPLALVAALDPEVLGEEPIGIGFAIVIPILYALCALIFVPVACWIYNLAARLVGGLELQLESTAG